MQYQSPSQDPRLTVDERLKLLYPMVRLFKPDIPHREVVQSFYPNVNFVKFLCYIFNSFPFPSLKSFASDEIYRVSQKMSFWLGLSGLQ